MNERGLWRENGFRKQTGFFPICLWYVYDKTDEIKEVKPKEDISSRSLYNSGYVTSIEEKWTLG